MTEPDRDLLHERREGAKYRATYGPASITSADIAAMWADPSCPVNKRPGYQCAICREWFPVCCLARDCERRHEEPPR